MSYESLVSRDWDWTLEQLGGAAEIASLARETKAFQRPRGIRSPIDLLRLVLSYCLTSMGLRSTAAWAEAVGLASVSDVALLGRFRNCSWWLQRLIEEKLARCCSVPTKGRLIRILDGSCVAKAGGNKSKSGVWRVHASFALPAERFDYLEVTDQSGGERFDRVPVIPGEIRMADAAFLQSDQIGDVVEQGGDVLVRGSWKHARWLTESNEPFAILDELRAAETLGFFDCVVWLGREKGKAPLAMRLLAIRKPEHVVAEARRRTKKAAQKQGRKASQDTLYANEWVILVTTLRDFSREEIYALYRLRWRIELAFKRLKSLIGLKSPPAKDPDLAKAWVLAHLLMILLVEPLLDEFGVSPH